MIFTVGNFRAAFEERGDDVKARGHAPQLGFSGVQVWMTRDEAERVASERSGVEVFGVVADWIIGTYEFAEGIRYLSRDAQLVQLPMRD